MDALKRFMAEQAEEAPATVTSEPESPGKEVPAAAKAGDEEDKKDEEPPLFILVTGAADTDTAPNKANHDTARDMKVPHIMHLPDKVAVKDVIIGSFSQHTVAVGVNGAAYAWGMNGSGQLGIGTDDGFVYAPTLVKGVRGAVAGGSCGRHHTALFTADGELYTCGRNEEGQLGIGRIESKPKIAFVKAALGAGDGAKCVSVACGNNFTLAADVEGCMWACGFPDHGCLANGSDGRRLVRSNKVTYDNEKSFNFVGIYLDVNQQPGGRRFEEPLSEAPKIKQVAAGKEHCMCLEDAERLPAGRTKPRVFSWGFAGYGRLGHRGQTTELRPRVIAEFELPRTLPVASLACGATCSFALDTRGSLYYWGKVPNAPRGEATMFPQMVQDLCNWEVSSAVGGTEAIFATAEGKVICWGGSVAGELALGADGPRGQRNPGINFEFSNWHVLKAAAGYAHAAFLARPDDGFDPEGAPEFEPPAPRAAKVGAARGAKRGAKRGGRGGKGGKRGRRK